MAHYTLAKFYMRQACVVLVASTGWADALAAQLHTWCNLLIGLVQEEN